MSCCKDKYNILTCRYKCFLKNYLYRAWKTDRNIISLGYIYYHLIHVKPVYCFGAFDFQFHLAFLYLCHGVDRFLFIVKCISFTNSVKVSIAIVYPFDI